jgi:hypothetical protein
MISMGATFYQPISDRSGGKVTFCHGIGGRSFWEYPGRSEPILAVLGTFPIVGISLPFVDPFPAPY